MEGSRPLGCMSVRILADPISHPDIRFYQDGLTAFTIGTQRGEAIRDRVKPAGRERDACGLFPSGYARAHGHR